MIQAVGEKMVFSSRASSVITKKSKISQRRWTLSISSQLVSSKIISVYHFQVIFNLISLAIMSRF